MQEVSEENSFVIVENKDVFCPRREKCTCLRINIYLIACGENNVERYIHNYLEKERIVEI